MGSIQRSNGNKIAPVLAQNNPSDVLYVMGDSVTPGSARYYSDGSNIYLQQLVNNVWTTLYTANPESTTVLKSFMAGTGSFHLGGVHSIGSAGENVIFKNNITGVNWFPAWQGITSDGTTTHIPTARTYSALTNVQPVGAIATSGSCPHTNPITLSQNTSFFNFVVVPAETFTGTLTMTATASPSMIVIAQLDFPVTAVAGTPLTVQLDYPLDGRTGEMCIITLTHPDGSLFNVVPCSASSTQPWYSANVRIFSDSNVWHDAYVPSMLPLLKASGNWQSAWTPLLLSIANTGSTASANTPVNCSQTGTAYGGVVGYDASGNPLQVTCSSSGLLTFPVAGTYMVKIDGHIKSNLTSDVEFLLTSGANITPVYNNGGSLALTNVLVAALSLLSPWTSVSGTCVIVATAAGSSQLQYQFVYGQTGVNFNGTIVVTRIA